MKCNYTCRICLIFLRTRRSPLNFHRQKKRRRRVLRNQLECGVRRLPMAHRFTVIFEKEAEGGYHVFCPTLPGCHTQSETIEQGVERIREAIELYVESLIEDGLPIPAEDIFIKPIEIPA
jgi:predicted RNase H-like HicB family nuclease